MKPAPRGHLIHVCACTRRQRRLADLLGGQLVDGLGNRQTEPHPAELSKHIGAPAGRSADLGDRSPRG